MLVCQMMSNLRPAEIASLTFLTLAAVGVTLRVVAAFRLRSHLRGGGGSAGDCAAHVTFWRAVKRGLRDPDDKLGRLVTSSRDGDQILLGADAGSAELEACEKLRARFPQRDITVVACEPGRAANPKISKFIQMQPHARHGHWLLTDSEALLDTEFTESLRREWSACGADAMTAGYRFLPSKNGMDIFDALPAITTLWPGLMLTRRIAFTLGACTALRADDLNALGGWEILSSDLAEDHRLGQLLVRAGKRIALSRRVLVLDCDEMDMREVLRHQHRVAVTYRSATPLGALGLPLLHFWPLAAACVWIDFPFGFTSLPAIRDAMHFHTALLVAAVSLGVALIGATFAIARMLGDRTDKAPFISPISSFVESACWLAAWFSPRVWWAGKWRRVSWRGRLA